MHTCTHTHTHMHTHTHSHNTHTCTHTHTHTHMQAHNRRTTVNIQIHRTLHKERHTRQMSLPDLIKNVSKMDFYRLTTYHISVPKINEHSENLLKNGSIFVHNFDTLPPGSSYRLFRGSRNENNIGAVTGIYRLYCFHFDFRYVTLVRYILYHISSKFSSPDKTQKFHHLVGLEEFYYPLYKVTKPYKIRQIFRRLNETLKENCDYPFPRSYF